MSPLSLTGQTLGKYQILEPLGRGGMARVYRAYHAQLDRFVAAKVLRADLVDDESFLSRFRREAQAVAALRHPNIIQVYDFDVHDEITFMVMELLDGDTLHTRLNDYRIRGERMPLGEIVRVLLDVLDGLSYAHDEGMIHRDIKPANILLTRRGQAVVADFGIAQIVGGTRHTVSGALLGTLNYMAPEQGLKGSCDARCDLYSMGVVLYEMLTRRPPFDADTPLAILMKHVNDPLPPPTTVDPNIPAPFERVVLKALAKQPEDRYQTAVQMAQALHQAAKDAGVELPETISLPLSFTTNTAPAESVAVYSGSARENLADAEFATDATDVHQSDTLSEDIAALKAAEPPVKPPDTDTSTNATVSQPDSDSHQDRSFSTTRAIFNGLGLILIVNLLLIMFSGEGGYASFMLRGWPIELLLVTIALSWIMTGVPNIWMFIPTGIIFGNALLFTYYTQTQNWGQWTYLWPLEPFLIIGVVMVTINLANRGGTSDGWARFLGWIIRWAAIAASIVITMIFITMG